MRVNLQMQKNKTKCWNSLLALMQKYRINNYLELKLENGKTSIYINDELFTQCKYLLLNISIDDIQLADKIDSIDQAVEELNNSTELNPLIRKEITPEEEFMGHCSNLEAWFENEYDNRILHYKLGFPLLKKLAEAGDPLALKVFKEEIVKRFEIGNINITKFLLYNGYLNSFNKEELEFILDYSGSNLLDSIFFQIINSLESPFDNYKSIRDILDLIFFIDLKYGNKYLFKICENLPKKFKIQFLRFTILHLNYKEFTNYTIPYGKFYLYFQQIVDYVYENYPQIADLFKFLDSGFYNASISLDENLSHGTMLND